MGLDGVAEGLLGVECVVVSAAGFGGCEDAGGGEFGDDFLDGTFGDADAGGDVAEAGVRVEGEADQDVGVVGEEGPAGVGRVGGGLRCRWLGIGLRCLALQRGAGCGEGGRATGGACFCWHGASWGEF